MRFVDSHLHLGDFQSKSRELALAEATQTVLLSCGTDRDSSGRTLRLSAANPEVVKAFVGVHPSEVKEGASLDWVEESLRSATGLGEVGLDPKYSGIAPGSPQMRALEAQLALGEESRKPVQVHSRGAARECLDLLGGYRLKSVLMHWFDGPEVIDEVAGRGYFVSFGPSILYSKRLQRMARSFDRTLVLTETDGPVQFEPLGGVNGPSLIPSVVFSLAEAWGVSFTEATETVAGNSARFLGSGEKG